MSWIIFAGFYDRRHDVIKITLPITTHALITYIPKSVIACYYFIWDFLSVRYHDFVKLNCFLCVSDLNKRTFILVDLIFYVLLDIKLLECFI